MTLLGRKEELAQLAELATSPEERALVVFGEPGSGKSALVDAVARDAGARLLRVNAAEATWHRSGLSALFAALPETRARSLDAALAERSEDQPFASAERILRELRMLRLDGRFVLLDDVDRMDRFSKDVLGLISTRLVGTGIRLAMTASAVDPAGTLAGIPAILLAPLDASSMTQLVRMRAHDIDDHVAQLLVDAAEGNPGVAIELLLALEGTQIAGRTRLRLPLRLGPLASKAASQRLGRLPVPLDSSDAILDAAVGPYLPAEALDLDEDAIAAWEGEHLLHRQDRWVAIAQRERSLIYWAAGAGPRREAHRRMAERLAGTHRELAAWHALRADAARPPAGAVEAAVWTFTRSGRTDWAGELAEVVFDRLDRVPVERAVELIEGFAERGDTAAAHRWGRLPSRPEDPSVRMRLALAGVHVERRRSGRMHTAEVEASLLPAQEADELVTEIAAIYADRWDAGQARRLLLGMPRAGSRSAAALERAIRELADALDAPATGDEESAEDAAPAEVVDAPTRTEGEHRQRRAATAGLWAQALCLRERFDAARALTAQVALDRGRSFAEGEEVRAVAALVELRAHDFHAAAALTDDWERWCAGREVRIASRLMLLAWRAIFTVDAALAEHYARESFDRASRVGSQVSAARAAVFLGELELRAGRPSDAIRLLRLAQNLGGDTPHPSVLRSEPLLMEALLLDGRRADAVRLSAEFSRRHAEQPTRWGRAVLPRIQAMGMADERAADLIGRALEAPQYSEYERAETQRTRADLLDRLGKHSDADGARAAARAAYSVAGAAWMIVNETVHDSTVVDSAALVSWQLARLSEGERAVVLRVQQGMKNREIAASLFVSQRTVEQRLTQVYRKLNARSRAHLAGMLG